MKSILQNKDDEQCLLCLALYGDRSRKITEEHHVMHGTANRKLAEQYGLKVYLCPEHHRTGKEAVHRDNDVDEALKRYAQRMFEKTHTHEEWMNIFRKNHL